MAFWWLMLRLPASALKEMVVKTGLVPANPEAAVIMGAQALATAMGQTSAGARLPIIPAAMTAMSRMDSRYARHFTGKRD